MESVSHEEQVARDRARQEAFLRQYVETADPTERARLLDQLVAALTPEEKTAGMARLQAWVDGIPPPELEATPEYTRYSDLLPQILAGTIDPDSTEYAEFMAFITQWAICYEEYQDLQYVMRAETNTRR